MRPPPGAPPVQSCEQRQATIDAQVAAAKAYATAITARAQAIANRVTLAISDWAKARSQMVANA
eukprot:3720317-Karenia_brevis.AAC.1